MAPAIPRGTPPGTNKVKVIVWRGIAVLHTAYHAKTNRATLFLLEIQIKYSFNLITLLFAIRALL